MVLSVLVVVIIITLHDLITRLQIGGEHVLVLSVIVQVMNVAATGFGFSPQVVGATLSPAGALCPLPGNCRRRCWWHDCSAAAWHRDLAVNAQIQPCCLGGGDSVAGGVGA